MAAQNDVKMIADLRRLANESQEPSISDLSNRYGNYFENNQQYMNLSAWLMNLDGPDWNNNKRGMFRGLLKELLKLHGSGCCHGNINLFNVMVHQTNCCDVKLLGATYKSYDKENLQAEYLGLVSLLRCCHNLPQDVEKFITFLQSSDVLNKNTIIIFNAPCFWEDTQIFRVVSFLGNKINRRISFAEVNRQYASIYNIKRHFIGQNGWSNSFATGMFSHSSPNTGELPLLFLRRMYAHPPLDTQNNRYITQKEITEEFTRLYPTYFWEVVTRLAADNLIMRGDTIDRLYVGAKLLFVHTSQRR